MKIATTKTKGTDPGTAGMVTPGYPWSRFGIDIEWGVGSGKALGWLINFNRWRQDLVIESQTCFN